MEKDKNQNDKRDDLISLIVNFPFISVNIPTTPAYWVYISQVIHYLTVCTQYGDILWTELSCWHKNYSTKATVVITNELYIHFLIDNAFCPFYVDSFLYHK